MDMAFIDKLYQHGIDYVNGVERFGGNSELFEKFVRRFPEDPQFGELQDHLAAHNTEQAFQCAHTLKGIVGNLSFIDYFDAISELTEALNSNQLDEALIIMSSVKEAHDKVLAVLEEL